MPVHEQLVTLRNFKAFEGRASTRWADGNGHERACLLKDEQSKVSEVLCTMVRKGLQSLCQSVGEAKSSAMPRSFTPQAASSPLADPRSGHATELGKHIKHDPGECNAQMRTTSTTASTAGSSKT